MLKSQVMRMLSIDKKTPFKCITRLITRVKTESFLNSEISTASCGCDLSNVKSDKAHAALLCHVIVKGSSVGEVLLLNASLQCVSCDTLFMPCSSMGTTGMRRAFEASFLAPGFLLQLQQLALVKASRHLQEEIV